MITHLLGLGMGRPFVFREATLVVATCGPRRARSLDPNLCYSTGYLSVLGQMTTFLCFIFFIYKTGKLIGPTLLGWFKDINNK